MYYLLGIDDTDSPVGDASHSTSTPALAYTLARQLESKSLAKLINISCHQLLQHPSITHTSNNVSCCILLDSEEIKVREIDLVCREVLLKECAVNSNPGYALASWYQFDTDVVRWGMSAKTAITDRQDCISLGRRCGIAIAGIMGSGAGVIGALAAVGLRYEGSDGWIDWMPGLPVPQGTYTQLQLNQFIHFDLIESDHHKRPALDDRIHITNPVCPLLKDGKIVMVVTSSKRGSNFEWQVLPQEQAYVG